MTLQRRTNRRPRQLDLYPGRGLLPIHQAHLQRYFNIRSFLSVPGHGLCATALDESDDDVREEAHQEFGMGSHVLDAVIAESDEFTDPIRLFAATVLFVQFPSCVPQPENPPASSPRARPCAAGGD